MENGKTVNAPGRQYTLERTRNIGIAAHIVWKKKSAKAFTYGVQFDLILGDVVTLPPAAMHRSQPTAY